MVFEILRLKVLGQDIHLLESCDVLSHITIALAVHGFLEVINLKFLNRLSILHGC